MRYFCAIMYQNIFNVWPKTILLPVWPRDTKRLDTFVLTQVHRNTFFYPKTSHEFVLLTTGLLLLDDSLWKTIAVNPHML